MLSRPLGMCIIGQVHRGRIRYSLVPSVPIRVSQPLISVCGDGYAFSAGGGAEHTGPDAPLMRRVYTPSHFGEIFWLAETVPKGFERCSLGSPCLSG